jgi:hypothetical protein
VTPDIPAAAADPVGVTAGLIACIEPGLGQATIEAVVTSVAGKGRAKRRRLACALAARPEILADGRSPAPRVVGDLLIALRRAGATVISAPACAGCGKQLRSLQRRGQDWYCAACGLRPGRCASCGQQQVIATVDRQGRPRCSHCPDRDDRDPLTVLAATVRELDPSLPAATITVAARRVFSRPGKLRQLAWAVETRPELLTGAGSQAPMPGVLRLIDELRDAGAQAVVQPACPRCSRVMPLYRRIEGQWCCRTCVAATRAQPCSRCGTLREPAIRDQAGLPLCPNCLITDPANLEACTGCGRRRPVSVRTPSGPLCPSCRPVKTMTCSICGRDAPCVLSETTGRPWCRACRQRWACCSQCGRTAPVRGGSTSQPLCAACTRPDPGFWSSCPGCGQTGRIHAGRCARCTTQRRLRELLGSETGDIRPGLQALYNALVAAERPATVEAWLNNSAASAILQELAGKQLSHRALDELPEGKTIQHLRSVLVAIGTLPARDEQMARLERWTSHIIGEQPDPGQQQLMHRYAVWHVTRRLRTRLTGAHATHHQVAAAQRNIRAACALLDWLTVRDLTLATAGQGDLEEWLISAQATHRTDAGNFVRWARRHNLTGLDFAAVRWHGPTDIIDTQTRWEQARWLLHDGTLKAEDRVAGLLILLYAQWPATISQLTLSHLDASDSQVRLRLGREPVVLPEPLDSLILQLAATRRGHAVIGDQGTSPWLFPGGQPGQPISAYRLAERLRQLGIRSGQSRSAALFQLATDLPAAVLARMLGIHITVAVAWQRASAGDWTAYAAQVSRRNASATAHTPDPGPS